MRATFNRMIKITKIVFGPRANFITLASELLKNWFFESRTLIWKTSFLNLLFFPEASDFGEGRLRGLSDFPEPCPPGSGIQKHRHDHYVSRFRHFLHFLHFCVKFDIDKFGSNASSDQGWRDILSTWPLCTRKWVFFEMASPRFKFSTFAVESPNSADFHTVCPLIFRLFLKKCWNWNFQASHGKFPMKLVFHFFIPPTIPVRIFWNFFVIFCVSTENHLALAYFVVQKSLMLDKRHATCSKKAVFLVRNVILLDHFARGIFGVKTLGLSTANSIFLSKKVKKSVFHSS